MCSQWRAMTPDAVPRCVGHLHGRVSAGPCGQPVTNMIRMNDHDLESGAWRRPDRHAMGIVRRGRVRRALRLRRDHSGRRAGAR
jgi:hypothetical protein